MKMYTFIVLFLHYKCTLSRSTDIETSSVTPITNTTEKYLLESFGEHANNNGKITVSKAKKINKNKCQDDSEILNIINHYDRDNKMVDFKALVIEKCKNLRKIETKLNKYKCYCYADNCIPTNIAVDLINKYGRNKLLYNLVVDMMSVDLINLDKTIDEDDTHPFITIGMRAISKKEEIRKNNNKSVKEKRSTMKINSGFISKNDAIELMNVTTETKVRFNDLKHLLLTYESLYEDHKKETDKNKNNFIRHDLITFNTLNVLDTVD
ncbi:uncharacterized protein LOC126903834 isoform X3 [Daktulosphaira vitifoliae]|uniref:uncharacterized protein LOC126903834 isoform X3 n=1 Tax=Daktulosphaira vitifoliae TaxID=58002 RepID=UPI0021AA533E|nr:uncharacterized protein LOC126903834 isoform X3 [Daktulosphaira vitifoliae]